MYNPFKKLKVDLKNAQVIDPAKSYFINVPHKITPEMKAHLQRSMQMHGLAGVNILVFEKGMEMHQAGEVTHYENMDNAYGGAVGPGHMVKSQRAVVVEEVGGAGYGYVHEFVDNGPVKFGSKAREDEQRWHDQNNRIGELQLRNEVLCAALEEAAAKFREYETLHLKKATQDGIKKAERNKLMADMCEKALNECEFQNHETKEKFVVGNDAHWNKKTEKEEDHGK